MSGLSRATVVSVVAVCLFAVFAAAPDPASAHGGCAGGHVDDPYKADGKVKVRVWYLCGETHAAMYVDGCLQKWVSGRWRNMDCDEYDSWIATGDTNVQWWWIRVTPSRVCSPGLWRGYFRYGEARNRYGEMAHYQRRNEAGDTRRVRSC
jgi:hypothetical protein